MRAGTQRREEGGSTSQARWQDTQTDNTHQHTRPARAPVLGAERCVLASLAAPRGAEGRLREGAVLELLRARLCRQARRQHRGPVVGAHLAARGDAEQQVDVQLRQQAFFGHGLV